MTQEQNTRYKSYKISYILMVVLCAIQGLFVVLFSLLEICSPNALSTNNTGPGALLEKILAGMYILVAVFDAISFAWLIPMTKMAKKAMDEVGTPDEKEHIILGIMQLFFTFLLPGIFTLVATSTFNKKFIDNNNADNSDNNNNVNNNNNLTNNQ